MKKVHDNDDNDTHQGSIKVRCGPKWIGHESPGHILPLAAGVDVAGHVENVGAVAVSARECGLESGDVISKLAVGGAAAVIEQVVEEVDGVVADVVVGQRKRLLEVFVGIPSVDTGGARPTETE